MRLKISVIIPAVNEASNISSAIKSAWDACADQVIVADGGSRDRTVELAKMSKATVTESATGRALQLNAGAAVADGDVLLFQHADCRLTGPCVKQVKSALTRSRDAMFGAFRQRIDDSG